MPTPCRAPQADAVQRAREVEEVLRDVDRSNVRNIDRGDLRELQELLIQPHLKVRQTFLVNILDLDCL